ncbi:hypothetical protein [Nostoc sp. DedQUE03]
MSRSAAPCPLNDKSLTRHDISSKFAVNKDTPVSDRLRSLLLTYTL